MCEGIRVLNNKYPDLDLIIVGRGGGSAEDLWTFNEESVARAIYESKIPVISAVGHEVDYVISDYVADLRGATPTAAAELAVPHIDNYKDRLLRVSPENIYTYLENKLSDASFRLNMLMNAVKASDPTLVLSRGYALVSKDGSYISTVSSLKGGDEISISFADGTALAVISEVKDAGKLKS